MKDELDKIEQAQVEPRDTTLTIVCGLAGAGKTTFTKSVEQAYSDSLYHDMWVEEMYDTPWVSQLVRCLFTGELRNEIVTKADVLEWLSEKPKLNIVLSNYFKSVYSAVLATKLQRKYGSVIAECPFLDENIAALKETFPGRVHVIWIDEKYYIIEPRLRKRGWSQERINMSLDFQLEQFSKYKHLIDDKILQEG